MKKLFLPIATLLLTALVFNFTACQWDVGSQQVTDALLVASTQRYNEALAKAEAASNSVETDEEGNVINDVYTRTSLQAMKDALPLFSTAGKTAKEIDEATAKVNAALELLVSVDGLIDTRLSEAVAQLSLYALYDVAFTTASGESVIFRSTDANAKGKTGEVVFVNEYGELVAAGTEGAKPIAYTGVESIPYDNETNSANFNLTHDSGSIKLLQFLGTGVLDIFQNCFTDITMVSFVVGTDDEGNTLTYDMEVTADVGGMYLAAGLIAICAGLGPEILESSNPIATIKDLVIDETYSFIAGKSCKAIVTFATDDYKTNLPFALTFSEIPELE